jgi:hypothetical protein
MGERYLQKIPFDSQQASPAAGLTQPVPQTVRPAEQVALTKAGPSKVTRTMMRRGIFIAVENISIGGS